MIWMGYEGALRPSRLTILRVGDTSSLVSSMPASRSSPVLQRASRSITLYEDEEPLAAIRAWHELRRRRPEEPVFTSIPWSDKRVSSTARSTGDIGRIVAKRSLEAGLGQANAMALIRNR